MGSECPASPGRPDNWRQRKTVIKLLHNLTVQTVKLVAVRPTELLTPVPPLMLDLTMLTTEHTLEDTELLDGTLTTPSFSDLDTKCHHQLHHQCHHLQG